MQPQDAVNQQLDQAANGNPMVPVISGILGLAILILMIVSMWKVFTKAGEPGWASIVPIYNVIVILKLAGKPLWWILLVFIPIVNFVIMIIMMVGLAEKFGKGAGFGLGLTFLGFIFFPILAFGDATYIGPKTP